MEKFINSKKSKYLFLLILIVLIWQLNFPQAAAAQTKNINNINNKQQNKIIPQTPTQQKLPKIPNRPQPKAKKIIKITITAYSSTPDQTSGNPFITASGTRVHEGTIAANFLPIGTKIRIPEHFGNKIFTVEDRMHHKYRHRADIWMPTRQKAKEWGIKYAIIEVL